MSTLVRCPKCGGHEAEYTDGGSKASIRCRCGYVREWQLRDEPTVVNGRVSISWR